MDEEVSQTDRTDATTENGTNGTTEAPEGTTQVIQFSVDGQEERFIVAQEVKVDVYFQDPSFEDYALISEAEGSQNNDSISLNQVSS